MIFPFADGCWGLAHLGAAGSSRPLPDLILLDRRMPAGPDGFEVLRVIRSLPVPSAVPVWMFSATHLPEDVERARRLGADAYLGSLPGTKYPELVQRILSLRPWRREENCGPRAGSTALALPASQPAPVAAPAPVFVDIASASMSQAPKAHEADDLLQAARLAKIPLFPALKKQIGDQILATKRKQFVVELMKLGWRNSEVVLFMELGVRYLEDCWAKWRPETGNSRGFRAALPG